MSRAGALKTLLQSPDITVLMEAHNGLSAKLVEEAGFPAIWASGLSISASLGLRDNNEASWTQVLDVIEFMADATRLPILLDGDTGYGNFNNVRRLVRKLEQRDVAGVCLEDKLFPKTNSFVDGHRQALADIDEFCGKLRAAKDTQTDPNFTVVARTEAFIAGWGLREALLRATAYAQNGADAILVHSARRDGAEIRSFMAQWQLPTPVVIVPTKYPEEPLGAFAEAGVKNFIFANQGVRTVITALQRNLRTLHETLSLASIEREIVPVSEVFRLQDMKELQQSEDRYLPAAKSAGRALVLAATQGNLGSLVQDRPKAMVHVGGKPLLSWHLETFQRAGIKDVGVVRGYRKEVVNFPGAHYFDNDEHEATGEVWSLFCAREFLRGDVLVSYGDVVYDPIILRMLLEHGAPITVAADAAFRMRARSDQAPDLARTRGVRRPLAGDECELIEIGATLSPEEVTGEFMGLLALRAEGTRGVLSLLEELRLKDLPWLRRASLGDLLNRLVRQGTRVSVLHTYGHWRDIDQQADLIEA